MAEHSRNMEFTSHQLLALNAQLPPKFKVDTYSKKETRPVSATQRRSEADNLDFDVRFHPDVQEKRPTREKRPATSEEHEGRARQGEAYKKLSKVLLALKNHPSAGPFLEPVDPKLVPDYYEVIKDPMDLSTVEAKLGSSEYESAFQFAMDLRKVWNNSFYYNAKGTDLYHMTMDLSILFEKLMRGHENLVFGDKKDIIQELSMKVSKLSKGIKEMQSKAVTLPKPLPKLQPDRPMSIQEKKNLCSNIKKLEPKYLSGIVDIVRESMNIQGEELVFDIEKLTLKSCRELERYVRQKLQSASRTSGKKPADEPRPAKDATSSKLRQIDDELEKLTQQSKSHTQPHATPAELDEESSSSDSDSDPEEDDLMPEPQDITAVKPPNPDTDIMPNVSVSSIYDNFRHNLPDASDEDDFTTPGFGSMIDIDRSHDMLE